MSSSVAHAHRATPRERIASVCATSAPAAKAQLPQDESSVDTIVYECIEATAAKFKRSDKEMSSLLRVAQSNYSRRSYNGARVQFLDLEMRRYFIHCYAKTVGLKADAPTPSDQITVAAKQAITTLLDLMEAHAK